LSDGRSLVLVEPIGRGSYGTVHRAILESAWGVQRPVAVKILDMAPEDDAEQVSRRLGRLARRCACIHHSSVVQLYEVDRTAGPSLVQPLVIMELVKGDSLANVLESVRASESRVPFDFALVVALKTAEALAAALFSERLDGGLTSLVHGDVSPRQILLSAQAEVKLGDFGHSRIRNVVSHVRSRDAIAYVPPEVAQGYRADPRSDVFSLGIILHEMLIGPRFRRGTELDEAIEMAQLGQLHMGLLEPNLPTDLRAVLDHALEADPHDRYPHARAFAFDLRREMLRMGLYDAQTCVRQAVVGYCNVREQEPPRARESVPDEAGPRRHSDIAPRSEPAEDTSPEILSAKLRR